MIPWSLPKQTSANSTATASNINRKMLKLAPRESTPIIATKSKGSAARMRRITWVLSWTNYHAEYVHASAEYTERRERPRVCGVKTHSESWQARFPERVRPRLHILQKNMEELPREQAGKWNPLTDPSWSTAP